MSTLAMDPATGIDDRTLVPAAPRPAPRSAHVPQRDGLRSATFHFSTRPRILTVVSTHRLSADLMRVRFRADDDFADLPSISPDEHLKLFFDTDEDGRPVLPTIVDGRYSLRGLTHRDFTIRWFDARTRLLDVDFVLHTHGVAGHWALAAAPGDQLGSMGPRTTYLVKDTVDWYVLAADETALPALARWAETLPEGTRATAYIEVSSVDSEIALPTRADLTVHWLHRGDAQPGTTTLLADAVMEHDFSDPNGYVWAAGEAMSIKSLRCFLTFRTRLGRDNWTIDGYWRRGEANFDRTMRGRHCPQCTPPVS